TVTATEVPALAARRALVAAVPASAGRPRVVVGAETALPAVTVTAALIARTVVPITVRRAVIPSGRATTSVGTVFITSRTVAVLRS
ncbi:hypothetical protein, partial [Micromonospora sp. NBRC 110038]|uniref:hypothetical protein n=1 Tax=Micromonospora sp. NBRC 110038 TaxID=1550034 RepID=UPI001E3FD029